MVQRAMEQQERLLALTAELKKALLHQLFTAGLRGEPQKQTEIGPVPESWEVVPLGERCRSPVRAFRQGVLRLAVTVLRMPNVSTGESRT